VQPFGRGGAHAATGWWQGWWVMTGVSADL
jgi:hypothetical protein